MSFGILECH